MEELLYEIRPYAFALIGVGAVTLPESFGRVCGLILLGIGVYIWKMRREYRRAT